MSESVVQGFKFNAEIGKEQNFRLAEKLQKMCQRVDTYIIANLYDNPEEGYRALAELAANHTFPAFQKRMSQEETSIKYHEQMHLTVLGKRPRADSADTEDAQSSALRVDLPKHRG